MADRDIPSFDDEDPDEPDEATQMWDRDGYDLPEVASLQVGRPGRPSMPTIPPPPGDTGLDERDLFADLLSATDPRSSAAVPVDGAFGQRASNALPRDEGEDDRGMASEPPIRPSLAVPAEPRGASFWLGVGALTLLCAVGAAYALGFLP